jgi:hypothetical protein
MSYWAWMIGTKKGSKHPPWPNGMVQGEEYDLVKSSFEIPGYANAATVSDEKGNVYMFAGSRIFKFTPDLNFAWLAGPSIQPQFGSWVSQGTPSPLAFPSARSGSAMWQFNSSLYIYGGLEEGNGKSMDDLWKYDLSNGLWTWKSGTSIGHTTPTYQDKDQNGSYPGGRGSLAYWQDLNGNLYLFGGLLSKSLCTAQKCTANDLLVYNVVSESWRWIHGSSGINDLGSLAAGGYPSARFGMGSCFKLGSTEAYIVGGHSNRVAQMGTYWKYDMSQNLFTLIHNAGDNRESIEGQRPYGVFRAGITPGARREACCTVDQNGYLSIYGGAFGASSILKGFFKFDVVKQEWATFASEDRNSFYPSVRGVYDKLNSPSEKTQSIMFPLGNAQCLYGGMGNLNEMWCSLDIELVQRETTTSPPRSDSPAPYNATSDGGFKQDCFLGRCDQLDSRILFWGALPLGLILIIIGGLMLRYLMTRGRLEAEENSRIRFQQLSSGAQNHNEQELTAPERSEHTVSRISVDLT